MQVERMFAILSAVEDDVFEQHNLERLRSSVAMLMPGQPGAVDLDEAVLALQDFQRLQGRDRRYSELIENVHKLLAGTGGIWPATPVTNSGGPVDGETEGWPSPLIPQGAGITSHVDATGTVVLEFVACP
jgi:hypothetical protein